MRYATFKKKTQQSFKKRYSIIGTQREYFMKKNLISIFLAKPITFEYIYWRKIKRVLKKIVRRKIRAKKKVRYKFFKKKAWIYIHPNFPISRKSKNARMGKGIGSFLRWSIRLRRNHKLLRFKRISIHKIIKLNKLLSFTFSIPFFWN